MVSLLTWFRYTYNKLEYSLNLTAKSYLKGQISKPEARDALWRHLFQGKLTYLHPHKGVEMAPTIGSEGGTLLIRGIPMAETIDVSVGDVVVLKDPNNSESHLVRRLAAVEGDQSYEMVSTDENEDSFDLEQDECWVLSDNEALKPKEAKDSRTFGPVHVSNIMGRVIYCMRNDVDHGPVQNSTWSMRMDSSVLKVELDVEEMAKNHKERFPDGA